MLKLAIKNIISAWRYDFTAHLATFSVLIGTFTVFATFLLLHQNLNQVLSGWGNHIKVSVYLNESADESDTEEIKEKILDSELFSETKFLSKTDAARRFKDRVGAIVPDLVSDLEFDNPLPASFELVVKDGVKSSRAFDQIVAWALKAKKWSGVEDVSYGQGWVENYATVLRVFSTTSYFFMTVLLSAGLFIIGNSIRSSLMARREEIEILELIGATKRMIILPYITEGFLMGFAASVLGLIVVQVLFQWQASNFENELQFWAFRLNLTSLSFLRSFTVVAVGTLIGGIGSWISASKISSGWTAAELRLRRSE
jgi:cell division transport system permease protein